MESKKDKENNNEKNTKNNQYSKELLEDDDFADLFNELSLKPKNEYPYIDKYMNIKGKYELSNIKKWIKLIPFEKMHNFSSYNRREYFTHVANIVLDNDLNKHNLKQRSTLIKFQPVIEKSLFEEKVECLYIFAMNDKIVKIGGTRTGLKGRVESYLCGHHIEERGKSGDCSKTNGFIYNTFYFYLTNDEDIDIKMYAYKIPTIKHACNILDENVDITVQTYHAYESIFLNDFKKTYGEFPILCDNADPNYKV